MLCGGKMSNEIIINRMFSGEYLEDENNIGHEIINIYKPKSKENKYYIYLVPYGDYSHEHSKNDIDAVLLVRGHNANCLEVIAKATGIERIFNSENYENWVGLKKGTDENGDTEFVQLGKNINLNKKQTEKRNNMLAEHKAQKEYIDKYDIRYGDKKVYELFANNTSAKYPLSIFLTFKADSIIKAEEPFFIVNEKFFINNKLEKNDYKNDDYYKINNHRYYMLNRDRLSGSAGATFFNSDGKKCMNKKKDESKEDFEKGKEVITQYEKSNYKLLKRIIFDEESLWGKPVEKYSNDDSTHEDTFSFLTITKKEYDELAFSNMFAYYFSKHKDLFKQFVQEAHPNTKSEAKEPLGIIIDPEYPLDIMREKKNIDLLIESGNHIFVIENKIKSGINGKKHDIYGQLVQTQLGKYMSYVEEEYADPYKRHYLIFAPDYNKIDSSEFSENEQGKDVKNNYKVINYSEIYSIFVNYYNNHRDEFINDKYFEDFLKGIQKHSHERDKDFEEIMKRKMQKLINESK